MIKKAILVTGLALCFNTAYPTQAWAVRAPGKKQCALVLAGVLEKLEVTQTSLRKDILTAFTERSKAQGRIASPEELAAEMGITIDELKTLISKNGLFADWKSLKNEAMNAKPAAFRFVIDTDIFNPERTEKLVEAIKNRKRLIVTTAVAGSPVNREFFEALQNYAKRRDAEIVVYAANMQTTGLDPLLLETPGVHILTNAIELTTHLNLNTIRLMAKQINPLMGLDRVGPRGQTQLVGSPKAHGKTIATINNNYYPHQLWTTGAVTNPLYAGEKYISGRTDAIAEQDHVMGAVILEKTGTQSELLSGLEQAGEYHLRQVEFIPEKNGFTDLDTFYSGTKAEKERPLALVLGDTHVGDHDELLSDGILKLLDEDPEYVVLHDFMNGSSFNHHDEKKALTLASKAKAGDLDVEQEFFGAIQYMNAILAYNPRVKIVIPGANHPLWINEWLEKGIFMTQPQNTSFGLELAQKFVQHIDPIQYAVLQRGQELAKQGITVPKLKYPERVIFVEPGNPFKIGPDNRLVEIGFHGHAGGNGTRGTIASFGRGTDRIVFGHTHTVARLNGAVNIGTTTLLALPYNKDGMSSWVQAAGLIGQNGEIQVLQFKEGEWFSSTKKSASAPEDFFRPNYPKVIPNKRSTTRTGQIDQWK